MNIGSLGVNLVYVPCVITYLLCKRGWTLYSLLGKRYLWGGISWEYESYGYGVIPLFSFSVWWVVLQAKRNKTRILRSWGYTKIMCFSSTKQKLFHLSLPILVRSMRNKWDSGTENNRSSKRQKRGPLTVGDLPITWFIWLAIWGFLGTFILGFSRQNFETVLGSLAGHMLEAKTVGGCNANKSMSGDEQLEIVNYQFRDFTKKIGVDRLVTLPGSGK